MLFGNICVYHVIDQAEDKSVGVARDGLEISVLSWMFHVNYERTG